MNEDEGGRRFSDEDELERWISSFAPVSPGSDARDRILEPARRAAPSGRLQRWWDEAMEGLGDLLFATRWSMATVALLFGLNLAVDRLPLQMVRKVPGGGRSSLSMSRQERRDLSELTGIEAGWLSGRLGLSSEEMRKSERR